MLNKTFYYSLINTDLSQLFFRFFFILKRNILYTLRGALQKKYYIFIFEESLPKINLSLNNIFSDKQKNIDVKLTNKGFDLTIFNDKKSFLFPIDWNKNELNYGTRLWKINFHSLEFLEKIHSIELIQKIIFDWISNVPPYQKDYFKDNWNSYTLSIRLNVCINIYIKYNSQFDFDFKRVFLRSLFYQANFLFQNLEKDINGNHIIKNIRGLFWAGNFFPELKDKFISKAEKLLKKELTSQILEDGIHFELSPEYHKQVFMDLIDVYNFIKNEQLKLGLGNVLKKMFVNIHHFSLTENYYSRFNDIAPDVKFSTKDIIDVGTNILGDFDIKMALGLISLKKSGFYGFKKDNVSFLIKGDRVGANNLPAHAHADIFSYELIVKDQPFIVDTGVYEYNPTELRDYSRSTKAHNTVTVNEKNQCEVYGSFRLGRRFTAKNINYCEDSKNVSFHGEFDGWSRILDSEINHIRKINYFKTTNQFSVNDKIYGVGNYLIENFIHLHPNVQIELNEGSIRLVNENVGIELTILEGQFTIQDGQYFPEFGKKLGNKVICLYSNILPTKFEYVFKF